MMDLLKPDENILMIPLNTTKNLLNWFKELPFDMQLLTLAAVLGSVVMILVLSGADE